MFIVFSVLVWFCYFVFFCCVWWVEEVLCVY